LCCIRKPLLASGDWKDVDDHVERKNYVVECEGGDSRAAMALATRSSIVIVGLFSRMSSSTVAILEVSVVP